FAIGPFIRYHLVQGVRFDPWMASGLGYRTTTARYQHTSHDYSGFEWLRLQIGGDLYPWSAGGIGAVSEVDIGVCGNRPSERVGSAVHWMFLTGARITLDFPGK